MASLWRFGVQIVVNFRSGQDWIDAERQRVEALGMRFVSIPGRARDVPDDKRVATFLAFVGAAPPPGRGDRQRHCPLLVLGTGDFPPPVEHNSGVSNVARDATQSGWRGSVMLRPRMALLLFLSPFAFSSLSAQTPANSGIWVSQTELLALPASGTAWNNVQSAANQACGSPDLSNQDQSNNVCILAKALVFARTGQSSYRNDVISALSAIVNSGTYNGRALALGRELAAYVIAADLIDLKSFDVALNTSFRSKIRTLLTTSTSGGPGSLIECHEDRPNNWGTHCGASRAAVAAYLGDTSELARVAQVFKGWLGDRSSYSGFSYGDLAWQCNSSAPVGINPAGCIRDGHSIDGVLPDDQRRGGGFTWPPPKENYVWEGLQGAVVQAVLLKRAGYDVFNWENQALRRAVQWLHSQANFPASGEDTWNPHLINYYYGTNFPAPVPTSPGKNMGWTDWTHSGTAPSSNRPPPPSGLQVTVN